MWLPFSVLEKRQKKGKVSIDPAIARGEVGPFCPGLIGLSIDPAIARGEGRAVLSRVDRVKY